MALDKFKPYLFVSAGEQSNKYLTPTITNGIAQFQAQRAQSITGLTVRIDPIQSGSGDPSPDNIRPISGRTGMTVTRAGKNLCPTQTIVKTGNSYYISGINNYFPFHAGTYTLSNAGTAAYAYWEKEGTGGYNVIHTGSTTVGTFTLVEDCNIRLWFYTGTAGATFTNIQIELGTTATAYEPYAGLTYPITWQTEAGTVYGGTLDVVSGVLTVTHIIRNMTSDLSWNMYTNNGYNIHRIRMDDIKASGHTTDYLVSHFAKTSNIYAQIKYGDVRNLAFNVYNLEFALHQTTTENEWKAFLDEQVTNGTPVQVYCYLSIHQTYQLTPIEVRTLAGYNQIYSDAGPVIDIKF